MRQRILRGPVPRRVPTRARGEICLDSLLGAIVGSARTSQRLEETSMSIRNLVAIAVGLATIPQGVHAEPACSGTRFVAAAPLLSGGADPDAIVLTSDEPQRVVRWSCGAGETIVRSRTRGIRGRSRWTACGTHERGRLRATIDPTCTTMVGKIKARGERRVTFTATADPCGTLQPSSPTGVFLDCAYGQTSFRAATSGAPAVRVVSIYESRSDHSFGYHPYGQASVQFDAPAPSVLFLESYEPTNFVVQTGAGAGLVGGVAGGYYRPG